MQFLFTQLKEIEISKMLPQFFRSNMHTIPEGISGDHMSLQCVGLTIGDFSKTDFDHTGWTWIVWSERDRLEHFLKTRLSFLLFQDP